MRECPTCFRCFGDEVSHCPVEGRATFHSLPGEPVLDGRYVLERRLGEGGMGVVYKAHHKFLRTTRAIKVIKPELMGNDPSFATRFQQEAMAAAAIGHPNIISVPDYGFLGGEIPFLVMEFVEGDSLQEVMSNEGKFSPEKALEYVRVIASAIGAAHAHGIVHRDLKPLNIMIRRNATPSEGIRVLDFGLAKIKSGELFGSFIGAKTTGIIGSPYYMAPEQWSDEEPDKRCDIYSVGIILHQMLTGDVPFKGAAIPVVMNKHLLTPPPRLATTRSGISEELERVVHHALEKNPRARTASAERLVAELEKAVLGSSASGGKATARRRTGVKAKTTTSRSKGSVTARITAEQKKARREEKELARSTADQQEAWRTTQKDETQPLEAETLDLKQQSAEREVEVRESNRNAEGESIQHARAAEASIHAEGPDLSSNLTTPEPTGAAEASIQTGTTHSSSSSTTPDPTGAAEPSIQTGPTHVSSNLTTPDPTGAAEPSIQTEPVHLSSNSTTSDATEAAETSLQTEPIHLSSSLTTPDLTGAAEAPIQTEALPGEFVADQREQMEEVGHTEPELKPYEVDAEEEPQREEYSSDVLPTAPLLSPPMHSTWPAPFREPSPLRTQIPYDQLLRKPLMPAAVVALIISAVVVGLIISAMGVYFLARTRPASEDATSHGPVGPRDMVFIKGGTFTMGSDLGPVAKPAHRVTVLSFYIDRTEVTNAEYAAFVKATGHPAPVNNEADPKTIGYWQPWRGTDPPPGREKWPVCNVSARDAEAFAQWISKHDGGKYRLPTEEEWEYAARNGSTSSLFPWGNSWVDGRANINDTSSPREVGSFPDGGTQNGVQDMIGNVWEWTASKASYYDQRKVKPENISAHVRRGGSFADKINLTFNATHRDWYGDEHYKFPTIGFRLVRDAK
jgi:formylglycine-generating enzyme required for sulfatase activity